MKQEFLKKIFLLVVGAAVIELVVGQEGHFWHVGGSAVRSVLLLVVAAATGMYFFVTQKKLSMHFVAPLALFGFALVGAVVGLTHGAPRAAVMAELAGYAFIFYLLPLGAAFEEFKKQKNKFFAIAEVGLCITAVATLVLFLIFSWHAAAVHGALYRWWRDVAFGKITDTGTAFFRITSAGHLWFVGTCLLAVRQLTRVGTRHQYAWWCGVVVSATVLIINFSRAYLLGVLVGLVVLAGFDVWHRARNGHKENYFFSFGGVVLIFVCIFITLNLLASKGASFGGALLFSRTRAVVDPESETSTRLRAEIFPYVVTRVRAHPFRGNGLGDAITFWSPSAQKNITTRSFDWGYMQTWNQLGLGGLLFLVWIIGSLLWRSGPFVKSTTAAYAVTHLFGPTFFHPIGMVILALLWCIRYYEPTL